MLDVYQSCRGYIERMLKDVPGMKILLLDTETIGMISLLMTKAELLDYEVYLMDYLDAPREALPGVKCICYLRPTPENIDQLRREFAAPRFSEYYLHFTSFVKHADLELLAEADARWQVMQDLQEFFSDCFAVSPTHFSFNTLHITGEQLDAWHPKALKRCATSLASVLLALKVHPVVRFDLSSPMAAALAHQLREVMHGERSLFDFRHHCTLLIVDRRTDLTTPLLQPWTYEAMLHELFSIQNGRVNDRNLSDRTDTFFAKHRNTSYGHLGQEVQSMVTEYKARTHETAHASTIAELRKFISEYAEYRALSLHVAKHVALADEIKRRVEQDGLMDLSELEQTIACHDSPVAHFRALAGFLLNKPDVKRPYRFKLVLVYVLRYHRSPAFNFLELIDLLRRCDFSAEEISMCDFILKASVAATSTSTASSFFAFRRGTLAGVPKEPESVYTQHYPPLLETVDAAVKGRLSPSAYPKVEDRTLPFDSKPAPHELIVFVVNGSTYAESAALDRYCQAAAEPVRIILGGTAILNSAELISELTRTMNRLCGS